MMATTSAIKCYRALNKGQLPDDDHILQMLSHLQRFRISNFVEQSEKHIRLTSHHEVSSSQVREARCADLASIWAVGAVPIQVDRNCKSSAY